MVREQLYNAPMSEPEDLEHWQPPLEPTLWVDGELRRKAASTRMFGGLVVIVGTGLVGVLTAKGWLPGGWLPVGVGVLGFGWMILLGSRSLPSFKSDAKATLDAPPERRFKVVLLPGSGWLRNYLAPATGAFLVVGDDVLRLLYRGQRNEFWLAALLCEFAVLMRLCKVGITLPMYADWIGVAAFSGLHLWSSLPRRDLRFPWARVQSVSAGGERFHVRVDGEDDPDGFLVQVHPKSRARAAALFAERTLFHDEDASAVPATEKGR
jgi:hypothetical protein